MAEAVGKLRDEQIVTDQQGPFHRARGDIERLEKEGADDKSNDKRVDDDADRFADPAFLVLAADCYGHLGATVSKGVPRALF